MEEIIRNVVRQMGVEKEEKANGNEIPLDISNELANTLSYQLQKNFKKCRRETQRYTLDEWTTPEKINKTILPYLKRHSTETAIVVNTIYKITENTSFQARVAMEIFEQLQYVLQEATSQAEATAIIDKCREQSRRLAVFGLATAKAQEKEARDYSDKALNIPISIRHLESAEEDPKTKNAYSDEFLNKFHQANFEQKLVQQASGSRGSFFGQGTPQRWGEPTEQLHQQLTPKPSTSPSQQQHPQQPIISTANYSIPTDGVAPGDDYNDFFINGSL